MADPTNPRDLLTALEEMNRRALEGGGAARIAK
jgi:hypothetical protein